MIDRSGTVPHEPVRIRRDVDARRWSALRSTGWNCSGVIVEETPMRDYLYGELADTSSAIWPCYPPKSCGAGG